MILCSQKFKKKPKENNFFPQSCVNSHNLFFLLFELPTTEQQRKIISFTKLNLNTFKNLLNIQGQPTYGTWTELKPLERLPHLTVLFSQ